MRGQSNQLAKERKELSVIIRQQIQFRRDRIDEYKSAGVWTDNDAPIAEMRGGIEALEFMQLMIDEPEAR